MSERIVVENAGVTPVDAMAKLKDNADKLATSVELYKDGKINREAFTQSILTMDADQTVVWYDLKSRHEALEKELEEILKTKGNERHDYIATKESMNVIGNIAAGSISVYVKDDNYIAEVEEFLKGNRHIQYLLSYIAEGKSPLAFDKYDAAITACVRSGNEKILIKTLRDAVTRMYNHPDFTNDRHSVSLVELCNGVIDTVSTIVNTVDEFLDHKIMALREELTKSDMSDEDTNRINTLIHPDNRLTIHRYVVAFTFMTFIILLNKEGKHKDATIKSTHDNVILWSRLHFLNEKVLYTIIRMTHEKYRVALYNMISTELIVRPIATKYGIPFIEAEDYNQIKKDKELIAQKEAEIAAVANG